MTVVSPADKALLITAPGFHELKLFPWEQIRRSPRLAFLLSQKKLKFRAFRARRASIEWIIRPSYCLPFVALGSCTRFYIIEKESPRIEKDRNRPRASLTSMTTHATLCSEQLCTSFFPSCPLFSFFFFFELWNGSCYCVDFIRYIQTLILQTLDSTF